MSEPLSLHAVFDANQLGLDLGFDVDDDGHGNSPTRLSLTLPAVVQGQFNWVVVPPNTAVFVILGLGVVQAQAMLGIRCHHSLGVIGLMVATLTSSARCQSGPSQIAIHDTKLRRQYEARIAQIFESIRRDSGLPKLSRINHRHDLEQLVCTAAVADANPSGNLPAALMYRTAYPETTTKDLEQIARFKDLEENPTPPWTRYSVAVWPAIDSESRQRVWWVGISIYASALMEWVDNNLTDDRA